MWRLEALRAGIRRPLAAAVEEILGLFEKTISEYEEKVSRLQEENNGQRQLLDAAQSPRVVLHRAALPPELQQLSVCIEELPPEQQEEEEPGPPHIKEEEEEFPVKTEHDEECAQWSQLHQRQTEEEREAEAVASTSTQQMETQVVEIEVEVDPEDPAAALEPGGAEQLLPSHCSESEEGDGGWVDTTQPPSDLHKCSDDEESAHQSQTEEKREDGGASRAASGIRKYYGRGTAMAKSKTRDSFAWTDDEVELLLKVTHEYKALNAAENIDWESSPSKYSDILERYQERYPSQEEAIGMGKEYPHRKDEVTKGQLTTKLKAIRFRFRQAVDSGRKGGHGRVVLLYFELCESIWGGSPATHAVSKGIKTTKSKTRDYFAWTDDEVELLLKVTHEYKALNALENKDWESSQSKYGDILERYLERYPAPEESMGMGKEYPHKKDEIMIGQLTTKLKAIRFRFRQVVDSGRISGHGRVVLLYFELCESIWGGSPATHAVSKGIKTTKCKTRNFFAWTNDEVELLLKVTHEYKALNALENIDWESLQSKYGDIFKHYREHYPSPEEAMAMGKEYPHKKDEITKGQLTTKLKAIRITYRQVVDSGRKSGHGRVVWLYFELCESIWGGSPATHAISKGIKTTKSKMRDFFAWTDDEVELLLKVTHEYKADNAAENIDWESSQSKYGDILERYREHYPSPEEAMTMGKEYPHKKDEVTKGQLTTKLKAIRFRFRQAIDSGRKIGHGRVVLLYFELCESIWGGSLATHAISDAIKTGGMAVEAVEPIASSPDTGSSSRSGGDRVAEDAVSAEMVANRRQRLSATLNGYRREKLKRKLSRDPVAQEDLDIKRRLQ